MKPVKKAVFPVAGLGTRFLPATKVMPKEMLPVVDKPLIQYAVEEAYRAGITEMIFVTSANKRMLEDHFDKSPELERELEAKGKTALLEIARSVAPSDMTIVAVRQSQPLGLGHAVLCAKQVVGDEPFAVILPDDLIDAEVGVTEQLIRMREKNGGGSVIAVQEVPREDTNKYGIVSLDKDVIVGMVEKPNPSEAPSNCAVVGRYVLESSVFDALENTERGAGGEIQLTDAIAFGLNQKQTYACRYVGLRFDCGSKVGLVNATVHYAKKQGILA
ncbi:MAG: UTP--glucose-1-phosphate uridylyltransferase GalU [Duodenibacillus sp.]|nr:UTP--glucose-1-phosphate uridylyltransferase GalU [Duodenibacillus sp.]